MRLISDDVDIDMYDVTERAQDWENVRINMKLGAITADNITAEERLAVRRFFNELPIVEPADPRLNDDARVIAIANLREGWEWCFATTRDGTFGVFALDEPARTFLEGATLHLWLPDPVDARLDGRVDFTDLADYQDAAIEASLAAVA